ncbi:unnamed protein product [Heligmosomoides polygyrus]|uniref:NTF2 domain-containing protein n=1 Tax=Heligmosomoides polygyrus TaxID=6339 RepID=A0A183GEW8_HELPZ|nr:unnamed protein product [Heligmosomoides polygyrus]
MESRRREVCTGPYESIATAFVQHYYSKFYQCDGIARAQGLEIRTAKILAKFSGLMFNINRPGDGRRPHQSFQIFILRTNKTGSFFIGNEIFRLYLHNNCLGSSKNKPF